MQETEHCPAQEPLRQGDIVKLDSDAESHYGFSLAAIINADCDMAHGKHDGVIAILPIYRFTEYLQKFWLSTYTENQIKTATRTIKALCKLEDHNIQELVDWIASSEWQAFDVDKLATKLVLGKKECQALSDAVTKLKIAIEGKNSQSLTCVKDLAPNPNDCEKHLQAQIADAKKSLGDGHFFVTDISGDDGIGFVVRMRRIYSIEAEHCFLTYSALQARKLNGSKAVHRLSRFSPHYKFKLAQIFAQQFSRIGLPDELMNLSSLAIDNAVQHIQSLK